VRLLLEMGADKTVRDSKGRTPYQRCLEKLPQDSCQPKMLSHLLATGSDAAAAATERGSPSTIAPPPKSSKWFAVRRHPRIAPQTRTQVGEPISHAVVVEDAVQPFDGEA
jgi:hypothetical protein